MDGILNTSNDSCNANSTMKPLEFNANLVAKIEEDYEKDENCVNNYLHQMNINACDEAHYSKDFTGDTPNGDIVKKDETESEDDEQPVPNNTNPQGETLLNSYILDEILSEKKKILLESPEVAQILQQHFLHEKYGGFQNAPNPD